MKGAHNNDSNKTMDNNTSCADLAAHTAYLRIGCSLPPHSESSNQVRHEQKREVEHPEHVLNLNILVVYVPLTCDGRHGNAVRGADDTCKYVPGEVSSRQHKAVGG